jgi:hypothetical protein
MFVYNYCPLFWGEVTGIDFGNVFEDSFFIHGSIDWRKV